MRIEAQGRYLQSILEKAQQTLAGQVVASDGLDTAQAELSALATKFPNKCITNLELATKVSTKCLTNSDLPLGALVDRRILCPEVTECSPDSCLTHSTSERSETIGSKDYYQSVDTKRPRLFLRDSEAKVDTRNSQEDMKQNKHIINVRSESTGSKDFYRNIDTKTARLFFGDSEAKNDEDDIKQKNGGNMERDRWSSLDERLSSSTSSCVWTHESECEPLERIERFMGKGNLAFRSVCYVERPEPRKAGLSIENITNLSAGQEENIAMQFPNRVSHCNSKLGGKTLDLNTNNDGDQTWDEA
mgnify:FL=1